MQALTADQYFFVYDAFSFTLAAMADRALFDLAIDSKLRGCDLVKVRVGELASSGRIGTRALVIQQKTGRPVQFELLEPARTSLLEWLERRGGTLDDFVFPSRTDRTAHIGTRQYARLVDEWVTAIGLGARIMERIHCAEPKRPSYTNRPATSGQCRFCLVIRKLRPRCVT